MPEPAFSRIIRVFRHAILTSYDGDALLAFVAFAKEGGTEGIMPQDWRDMFNLRGCGIVCPGQLLHAKCCGSVTLILRFNL